MTNGNLRITDAEMRIMKILWQADRPLSGTELNTRLAHTGWKRSTIHSLGGRLENKGMIRLFKINGNNHYIPAITEFDYAFIMTKIFVDQLHGGSLVEMVRTLLCDWDLSREELDRLKVLVSGAELAKESFGVDEEGTGEADTIETSEVSREANAETWTNGRTVWFLLPAKYGTALVQDHSKVKSSLIPANMLGPP